jgi:hypothetical protein
MAVQGICLEILAAMTLQAYGNIFGSTNCSTTAGKVTLNKSGCGNGACTGSVCDLGVLSAAVEGIAVGQCM